MALPSKTIPATQDQAGTFKDGSFQITHRDNNSLLNITLNKHGAIIAKQGVMVAMSPTMELKIPVKVSLREIFKGHPPDSTFTGHGELKLAPSFPGDISYLVLDGHGALGWQWCIVKDGFLACTSDVLKDMIKSRVSAYGVCTYVVWGTGVIWIAGFGAIVRKDLQPNEHYTVNNRHLVAWNTKYVMEIASSRGTKSSIWHGEGFVCKFTGPGTVYYQTRNASAFASWLTRWMYVPPQYATGVV